MLAKAMWLRLLDDIVSETAHSMESLHQFMSHHIIQVESPKFAVLVGIKRGSPAKEAPVKWPFKWLKDI